MLHRDALVDQVQAALERSRVVLLVGPRQVGKTTLARHFVAPDSVNTFDLEDPRALARLDEPMVALEPLRGVVVIDEIQRRPDLFPILRVLSDREGKPATFLILGSATGDLMRQSSESLAGRIERIEIGGFTLTELDGAVSAGDDSRVDVARTKRLWLRGGFPLSYLATSEEESLVWRRNYIQTLLERDFPQWGVRVPANALRRFWNILAHYHGQTWNAAEAARALDVSQPTVRRYLDILSDAFMVRQLQPYFANLRKRQVKSPKIYVRDTGLLHQLLGIEEPKDLLEHPKVGASWEGFAIDQVLATVEHDEAFFWATHQGAEIDLVLRRGRKLLGVECKRKDAPRMTPSIRHALDDLKLDRVVVLYPGTTRYPLRDNVEVVPLTEVASGTLF